MTAAEWATLITAVAGAIVAIIAAWRGETANKKADALMPMVLQQHEALRARGMLPPTPGAPSGSL